MALPMYIRILFEAKIIKMIFCLVSNHFLKISRKVYLIWTKSTNKLKLRFTLSKYGNTANLKYRPILVKFDNKVENFCLKNISKQKKYSKFKNSKIF